MADFSSSSSIKQYNSFGNTSAITTASARKDIQYKSSKDANELIYYGTVNGEDVIESFSFGNVATGTYSDVHAKFKISDTASYSVADLIKGGFTDSEGNSYSLYGSDSEDEQFKVIIDWLREEVEERYNPSHSSQFYQFTSDEQMEKYVCEIIGIDDTNRESLIESFKLNNASQLEGGEFTYSDIFAGLIQNKMIEAYQEYQNEIFEEDAANYKHFEEQYLLKELDKNSVIYNEYADVDITTLSDEEKIKWFYEFIDNETKLDFYIGNGYDFKAQFDNAETFAEKEEVFAANCMALASKRMEEIDEQRFQDSLSTLEKVMGVVYETGENIGKNFEVLWNSEDFGEAIGYILVDGTAQFFNDLQDGLFTLGGYAIKGVGHAFVDDDALWDEAVGEAVNMYNEGNIADDVLWLRRQDEKFNKKLEDPDYFEMYYAARQLGRDGEMMIINMLGAPEIALPASILTATGQQYNAALAQGASFDEAIDYGTLAGGVSGTVDFLLGRALGHVGGGSKAATSAFAEQTTAALAKQGSKSTLLKVAGKIVANNGGGGAFALNLFSAAANPYANAFFKAATFSDDSFSDIVKKDKVFENAVVGCGKSLISMSAMGYLKSKKVGMKFEQITGKIREKTSFKNSKAIFVSDELKELNKISGGGKIDGFRYKELNDARNKFTNIANEKLNTRVSKDIVERTFEEKVEYIGLDSETSQRHLNEIMDRLNIDEVQAQKFLNIYYDGMIAAKDKYSPFFKNFRDHSIEHTREVTDYAVNLANRAKQSGLDVDLEVVAYAAMCHDLGMEGGYAKIEYTDSVTGEKVTKFEVIDDIDSLPNKIYYVGDDGYEASISIDDYQIDRVSKFIDSDGYLSPEGIDAYSIETAISDLVTSSRKANKKTFEEWDEAIKKYESATKKKADSSSGSNEFDFSSVKMKDLNVNNTDWVSVINEDYVGTGLSANNIRENLVYSKEYQLADYVRSNHPLNSALKVLGSDLVPENIRSEVALLAMSHSKSTSGIKSFDTKEQWVGCVDTLEAACKTAGVDFDAQTIRNKIENDPVYFEKLCNNALAVRDGDAMSKVPLTEDGKTKMQTGAVSNYKFDNIDPTDVADSWKTELNKYNVVDNLEKSDGTIEQVINQFSKKVHGGETNVEFDSYYRLVNGEKCYSATAKVSTSDLPYATADAISERLGEVVTYTNVKNREFNIEIPKIDNDNYYQAFKSAVTKFKREGFNKFGAAGFDNFVIKINGKVVY